VLRFAGVSLPSELIADRVLPHVPVDQFLHMLSLMGGAVAAKQQALLGGFVGSVAVGVVIGGVYAVLARRRAIAAHIVRSLAIAVVAVWVVTLVLLWPVLSASYIGLPPELGTPLTALALLLEYSIYVVVLHVTAGQLGRQPATSEDRRRLMLGLAGAVVGLSTVGLAGALYKMSALGYDGMTYDGPVEPTAPNQDFYVVTKNLIDPRVFEPDWRLELTGQVAHPATYRLSDLTNMPNCLTQETTLECISNGVGRGLISNAAWHGIPLRSLLQAAGPASSAVGVTFHAVDGYVHTTSLDTAMADETFLAWLMNGQPLPDRHGYPLRLLVPSAYGEVSVKWLTRIDVVDHTESGYYETQGWQPRFVHTMSRIDSPKKNQALRAGSPLTVQGIAYAADRGISAVEVSFDGEASWSPAQIGYGKPMTWYTWTADWTPQQAGSTTVVVRARDGRGDPQTEAAHGFAPAGATGLHRVMVTVMP
jgi:DMSO/TMAO reductase YedYZ molybdopterin-dependent catalytic subunit